MRINKILPIIALLTNLSFALDRCDVLGVFLNACNGFGQKHGYSSCDDFKKEIRKLVKDNSKTTTLFEDSCYLACKTGAFNKSISDFGVNTFVKMCKVLK